MDDIDDVDRELLGLLLEDGRRPFAELADHVDLSPPAVSDRIDRLRDRGLIRRFTVDVDRSMLREGRPVLVTIRATPGTARELQDTLVERGAVEHAFRTVDERVVLNAAVPNGDPRELLEDAGVLGDVAEYDVRPLADATWTPTVGSATLSPTCAECGNTVDEEGAERSLDGEQYFFCCESCEANFVEQYDELREGA